MLKLENYVASDNQRGTVVVPWKITQSIEVMKIDLRPTENKKKPHHLSINRSKQQMSVSVCAVLVSLHLI